MKMFATIRFYWGSFVISFIAAGIMIPLLFVVPRYKAGILHYFNRLMMILMGGSIITEGDRDMDADMVLMNHQGIIDIVSMEAVSKSHMRWVAKKELFDALWFGNLLEKTEMISIDRQSRAGLKKLLRDSQETVESMDRAIAIFPEGTRASGQKLLSFKAGTAMIANRLKLRVQPVVITGSKLLLNEHNKTAHSSVVKIQYLPAFDIDGAGDDWYEKLAIDMQKSIDMEYEKYSRER